MSDNKRPSPPKTYRPTQAAAAFREAGHQLRGLCVEYCFSRSSEQQDPTEDDLRWTDEIQAEFLRVDRAVAQMVRELNTQPGIKP